MKSKPGRSTAYDVANLAGVSQSAVSRAFTPGASVSHKTRQKIMQAAEELGYRPNALARSLTTKQTNIIGVAVGHLINPYFSAALDELTNRLSEADLRLLLFPAHYETSIQQIMQYQLEALIMLSVLPGSDLTEECRVGEIPMILFNRTTQEPDQTCVIGDNLVGGRTLAAYLLAGGHERFAFLSAGIASTASQEREAGYSGYLSEQGLALHSRDNANFSIADAAAATRRLLLQKERPDAIFCGNDHVAMIALQVAQSEFGIDVGRELSIVGFDDVPQASWPGIGLTTYSQPVESMVERTLSVIAKLRSGEAPDMVNIVPGDLIVRSTSRRPIRVVRT